MAHRDVSMVCRGFVVSSLVMLGGFLMMKRRMLQVFCNLLVVSCGLLRHGIFLRLNDRLPDRLIVNAGDHRDVPMEEPELNAGQRRPRSERQLGRRATP